MELAAVGAAASLSMADVDFGDVGKKEGSQFTMAAMGTLLLAGGSATLAVLAMAIYGPVSIVAGVVALAITPIVLIQRFHLNKLSTFREIHNKLRQNVNKISMENDDLERQTTRLHQKAERVKMVESNLDRIVAKQGGSVDQFVNLVKENGVLQQQMGELLTAQVAQQLMSSIVRADRDQDFDIEDQEVDQLIFQIRAIRGVDQIDENQLRMVLKKTKGLEAVINVIHDMMMASQGKQNRGLIQVSSRALVF